VYELSLSESDFSFYINDTASTVIYSLSLHDALPIFLVGRGASPALVGSLQGPRVRFTGEVDDVRPHLESGAVFAAPLRIATGIRSEEHTSELQSRENLVCRLLLEKKKNKEPNKWFDN